jgi:hypothetical protein
MTLMREWHKQRLAQLEAAAPVKQKGTKAKYAHVPLPWGYQVVTVAGRGAAIALYAIHMQKMKGRKEVAITAAVLKECGVDHRVRSRTIGRLVKAGLATTSRNGKKHQGCPRLTMLLPESD